jgi:hypothetical protein
MHFVLAMTLFPGIGYLKVWDKMTAALEDLGPPGARRATPPHGGPGQRWLVQGVIAIAYGPSPTWIGCPGVLVAVAIGTTVPGSPQTPT